MNGAAGELVPSRIRERLGDRFNADVQTSNRAHWRGRMNGAAGELVPGRMRERLGDRFNADAPKMQQEEEEEQKIERAVIIRDSPMIISNAKYLILLMKDNFKKG